jgi:hypothetical protein
MIAGNRLLLAGVLEPQAAAALDEWHPPQG